MAVKLASSMGAEVTVLSTSPEKEADAMQLGAHKFVVSKNRDEMKRIRNYFDFIINTVSASINLNPYFMSAYTMYHANDLVNETTLGEIDATILLNAKVSYQLLNDLRVFANVRNLFSGEKAQFYGTDVVKPMVLGGLSFQF